MTGLFIPHEAGKFLSSMTREKALEIQPGKTYVLETGEWLSKDSANEIRAELDRFAPDSRFIILDAGMKIARHTEFPASPKTKPIKSPGAMKPKC